MFVDSHCHAFDNKIDFASVDLKDIDSMLVCSYSMDNLQRCLSFCENNKKCFCALGVHPEYIDDFDEDVFSDFVVKNAEKIVAIGEIGLDCTYNTDYEKQKQVFEFQLKLAKENDLPVSVHLRTKTDYENFFEIKERYKNVKCALHCFLGNEKDLRQAIELNCFFSFAGNITYKRNVDLRKIVKLVPLDRLLIETDSPSMLPSSFGRKGINTPQNIVFVAEMVAQTLGLSVEKIADVTTQNANSVFGFKRK